MKTEKRMNYTYMNTYVDAFENINCNVMQSEVVSIKDNKQNSNTH